ncbi:HypC/HybG/HupF family hydrogenase formation chaperone [Desulfosporosinus sp.]|uniref:HypC/HybG/HupF family hydrogenase formation chaperone n=1 Tax=Desulfosporosinus sp. TaxID=157907 RepID=UPI002313B184|nr:HypC/HybG/HupF family hydrogenase formation chaperone [Desulfosporosinus sp.]MCO5385158.1 HypC/HybG/HupF family hydrogenase formation chaperone [Desulfosporosinus sp.]MDA8221400.1 HypC/HybG/HupF family hydrogenase formation chaperone [Desulfitobacterium hafniense]
MCLAVPGRVLSIDGNMGIIEVGNLKRNVFLHLIAELSVDDYVLVHAGCAIQKLDEEEAKITLNILKELAESEICR